MTGLPYGRPATVEVLEPAGMADSGLDQRDDDPPGLATGYLHEPDRPLAAWKSDPGVSTTVARHPATRTTIVVLGNHDRGTWPVYVRLAAELGLTDPRD